MFMNMFTTGLCSSAVLHSISGCLLHLFRKLCNLRILSNKQPVIRHKILEEQRPQLHCFKSLKTCIFTTAYRHPSSATWIYSILSTLIL